MLIFRWIILLLLVSGLASIAMYIGTGDMRYRILGVRIIKWTVVAGLEFFVVLIFERLALLG